MNVFDLKKAIDQKDPVEWDDAVEKIYVPFLVNRAYSFNQQTILFAAELNKYPNISKKQHFDFLFQGLPKSKRYDKWEKQETDHNDVLMIQSYYDINITEARRRHHLLTTEQLDDIRTRTRKGGRT